MFAHPRKKVVLAGFLVVIHQATGTYFIIAFRRGECGTFTSLRPQLLDLSVRFSADSNLLLRPDQIIKLTF